MKIINNYTATDIVTGNVIIVAKSFNSNTTKRLCFPEIIILLHYFVNKFNKNCFIYIWASILVVSFF